MDILKLRYSGRVTAGRRKKFDLPPSAPGLNEWGEYISLVLRTHSLEAAQVLIATLGLSSVANLQKKVEPAPRAARGSKGISSDGRQTVRDAALLLQDSGGRQNLSFVTLTIPPEFVVPSLFERWSDVVRLTRQRLVYHLQKAGLSGQLVGVVEVQERRQSDGNDLPYLHLHIVFQGRKHRYAQWVIGTQQLSHLWIEVLEGITGMSGRGSAASRIEAVRKDASNYLAKYMSKGIKSLSKHTLRYLPPSWYICTSELRRDVKRNIKYICGEGATMLYEYLLANPQLLKFSREVSVELTEGWLHVIGWYGDMRSRYDYASFRALFESILELDRNDRRSREVAS